MSKWFLVMLLFLSWHFPAVSEAKVFTAPRPAPEEITRAILDASGQTKVRAALLFGLLVRETGLGRNLGKRKKDWNDFCAARSAPDCIKWKQHDCKDAYENARHFDDILKSLGYVDSQGRALRDAIPTSSTCAIGFTQFEPNTWWLVARARPEKLYNPWDIRDAILMTAFHLGGLGADADEVLGANEVVGSRDRIALQKYYCGGGYRRPECAEYAHRVEDNARLSFEALLKSDLERQLELLQHQLPRAEYNITQCQEVSTDEFGFGTAPDSIKKEAAIKSLGEVGRDLITKLRYLEKLKSEPSLRAAPDEERALLKEIQELASTRKNLLVESIYRDPDRALFSVLLPKDREALSTVTAQCAETEITAEGILEVLQVDFGDGSSQTRYALFVPNLPTTYLHPAQGLYAPLESGTQVRVRGIRMDNELLFNGSRSLKEAPDFSGGIDMLSAPPLVP